MAFAHDKKDAVFSAYLMDQLAIAQKKYIARFTGFLDMNETSVARRVLVGQRHDEYMFSAGYPDGERVMLGVFAPGDTPEESDFPIVPITFRFREEDMPGHRDFLGSILALGIKRETIGDILIGGGIAVLFTTTAVAPVIMSELTKIGRYGVKTSVGLPDELPAQHSYEDRQLSVSSLRLDCVIAAMLGLSREKATQTIRSQLVSVNGVAVAEISSAVRDGDIISVRGFGKFLFVQVLSVTKKDRLRILCKRYI